MSDTNGLLLRSRTVEYRINAPEDAVLRPLIRIGTELLDSGTGERLIGTGERLIGIGVSVPAPVEADTGTVVHPTTIPGWRPHAVTSAMTAAWHVPVVVEKDAAEGQPDVEALLLAGADVLGGALAATVATVNPDRLVLGGKIGTIPLFADRVRDRVLRDVVERISDGLTVTAGEPGDTAAVDGLTRLVIRKVYSPDAIDSLLTDYLHS